MKTPKLKKNPELPDYIVEHAPGVRCLRCDALAAFESAVKRGEGK